MPKRTEFEGFSVIGGPLYWLGCRPGLFNALVLEWVSPKCNTLMQTAVG
jgi:hypothetical protein